MGGKGADKDRAAEKRNKSAPPHRLPQGSGQGIYKINLAQRGRSDTIDRMAFAA